MSEIRPAYNITKLTTSASTTLNSETQIGHRSLSPPPGSSSHYLQTPRTLATDRPPIYTSPTLATKWDGSVAGLR